MAETLMPPATADARRPEPRAPQTSRALASSKFPLADAPEALPFHQVSETVAVAGSRLCSGSVFRKEIRRALRKIADGEQIPTGTNRTKTGEEGHQASVIVLVTSFGNVTVRAN